MQRLTKNHGTFTLGDHNPVIKTDLPANLILETQDCYSGMIQKDEDTVEQSCNRPDLLLHTERDLRHFKI